MLLVGGETSVAQHTHIDSENTHVSLLNSHNNKKVDIIGLSSNCTTTFPRLNVVKEVIMVRKLFITLFESNLVYKLVLAH